jgi:hypothetical protein
MQFTPAKKIESHQISTVILRYGFIWCAFDSFHKFRRNKLCTKGPSLPFILTFAHRKDVFK